MKPVDVIMLVVVGTIILVALIIYGQLQAMTLQYNFGVQGNATRTTIFNNIWASMNLASIGLIIIAAISIIAVILSFLGEINQSANI